MILAEKITEERKKNGWSQEELAERLSVSRQSVSKWESAQSIPDLQKIIRLAELFDVTTDYLLKDELEPEQLEPLVTEKASVLYQVSMEEANAFLEQKLYNASRIALGVALCILSPALLILLAVLAEGHVIPLSENAAAAIGIAVLLGLVAAGVYLFISCGMKETKFEFLQTESFETAYGVNGLVKEKKKNFEPYFSKSIAIGVVLCIVAVIPTIVGGAMEAPDYVCGITVALLLVCVAVGVYLMVRAGVIQGSYTVLLQEGEFTPEEKRMKKKTSAFATIYWCTATAIYLAWSFSTMRWDRTWIIWPVAGVLFAAANALVRSILHHTDK